jgi:hypothetical protein
MIRWYRVAQVQKCCDMGVWNTRNSIHGDVQVEILLLLRCTGRGASRHRLSGQVAQWLHCAGPADVAV